jgi:hypothetical protein
MVYFKAVHQLINACVSSNVMENTSIVHNSKTKKNTTDPDTRAGPSQASRAVKRSIQQTGDNNDDLAASMEPTRPAKSAKQYDASNVKNLPPVIAKTAAHYGNSVHLTHSGLACYLSSSHHTSIKPVFQQVF